MNLLCYTPSLGLAVLTAISMISTLMSSASLYSQDSWKTASPSTSAFMVGVNLAISTSPTNTIHLSHIVEEEDSNSNKGFTLKSPSVVSDFTPPWDVSFSMVMDTVSHSKSYVVCPLANNAVHESVGSVVDVGMLRTLRKRLSNIKSQREDRSEEPQALEVLQSNSKSDELPFVSTCKMETCTTHAVVWQFPISWTSNYQIFEGTGIFTPWKSCISVGTASASTFTSQRSFCQYSAHTCLSY